MYWSDRIEGEVFFLQIYENEILYQCNKGSPHEEESGCSNGILPNSVSTPLRQKSGCAFPKWPNSWPCFSLYIYMKSLKLFVKEEKGFSVGCTVY